MKKLFPIFLTLFVISGCKSNDLVVLSYQRDSLIGTYVSDVRLENYTTSTLLTSYVDTLVISKFGIKEVQFTSYKKNQLPVLQILQANAYYGLLTVLRFEKEK